LDVVPWLALLVAVLSLGWQIVDATRRRRTRLDVQVHHLAVPASIPDGPELLALPLGLADHTIIPPTVAGEHLSYVLTIVVANAGETTEHVADIRVSELHGHMASGADHRSGGRPLPPRDRVTWAFRPARLPFDASEGFMITVVLGSGSPIESGPHRLDEDLLSVIEAHNSEAPSPAEAGAPDPLPVRLRHLWRQVRGR
jgi:hypothetical protein